MTTKPILILPSGSITAEEKKAAQDGGYIVIITDEPERVKLVTPISTMDGLDLMNAAVVGLHKEFSGDGRKAFFAELVRQIEVRNKLSALTI